MSPIWVAACAGTQTVSLPGTDGAVSTPSPPDGGLVYADSGAPAPQPDAGTGSLPADSGVTPDVLAPDAVPDCAKNQEVLDGQDNDCDGYTDEGFWAVPEMVGYATLATQHPGCSAQSAHSGACNAAARRHCAAKGFNGGFGPVEYGASDGAVVCLADAVITTRSFAQLTAEHPDCGSQNAFSLYCASATHRVCRKLGYETGIGPLEASPTEAHFLCTRHAWLRQVSFATLATHHSGCSAQKSFSPDCQAAINRYCVSMGQVTGYGPVEQGPTSAQVACLDAK